MPHQIKNISAKKIEINLNKKQNLSFIAAAVNHLSVRKKILEELSKTDLFDKKEIELINQLKKKESNLI